MAVYTVKLCVLVLLVVDATGQNVSEVKLPGITPPPVPLLPLLPPPPSPRPGMDGVLNKVVYLTRSTEKPRTKHVPLLPPSPTPGQSIDAVPNKVAYLTLGTVASSDLIRQATPPPEEAYGIPDKEIYLSKSFDLIATASFDALPQPDIDVTVDPEEELTPSVATVKPRQGKGSKPVRQVVKEPELPSPVLDKPEAKVKILQSQILMTLGMPQFLTPRRLEPQAQDMIVMPKIYLTSKPILGPPDVIVMPEIHLTSKPILQKGNTSELGEQSGVSNNGTEKVTLYVTSVMYYVSPVILVCGATLQIFLILRFHRDHLGSYITMLFDSVMKLIFIIMVLVVIHYDKRDTLICGIRLCTEMTCIGCVCLSTMLATLYKLIMIKFPLTSYRWTSTRTQLKVCLLGTLFVFVCSTWIGWDTFELGTQMGFCNYKSNNYRNFMIGWIVLIIGGTTIASVCMLIYIAYIVLKFRIQKVKRDGNQKSASATKTETSFVLDTSVSVDNSGAIPVKAQPMVKVSEKSSPPEKAKFPSQIIVLILLTMGMALPWIPGFIKPMLYYKGNRIVLDIMFSAMLLLIAVSPFLTTILRLSLRNDLIGLFKRVKR